jgi:hypothetical protein
VGLAAPLLAGLTTLLLAGLVELLLAGLADLLAGFAAAFVVDFVVDLVAAIVNTDLRMSTLTMTKHLRWRGYLTGGCERCEVKGQVVWPKAETHLYL